MFSDPGRFELIRRGLAVRVSWSGPTLVSASAKGQRGLFSCNVTFYKRFRLWLRGSATLIVYCSERSGYDLSLISDLTVQLKEKCTEATSPGHLGQRKQCFQGFGYVRILRSLVYFFGPIRNSVRLLYFDKDSVITSAQMPRDVCRVFTKFRMKNFFKNTADKRKKLDKLLKCFFCQ